MLGILGTGTEGTEGIEGGFPMLVGIEVILETEGIEGILEELDDELFALGLPAIFYFL